MPRHTVHMREDRQEPHFDAVIMSVYELSRQTTRDSLIRRVTQMLAEEPDMRNIARHVDRMVAAMVRNGHLARRCGRITLTAALGAQQTR